MSDLFLHPPFDDPAVRALVTGPEPLTGVPATLADHRVRADGHAVRVALVAAPGESVAGVVVRPGPAARERLDFALAAMGAEPVEVGGLTAYVFRTAEAGEWPGTPGPEERRARFAEALTEIMGHHGRRSAAEMAGLLHGIGIRALARTRGAASPRKPSRLGRGFDAADVDPAARAFSYARYFAMEEHLLRHRRFDGAMSEEIDRAVFTSGDAVTVLPFDPRSGTVLLVEQFRSGPWARRDPRPWSIETVAGRCDRTEPPEETARREAREEAGLELGRIERIAAFYPSPGIVAEHITAFVAEADLGAAGGTFGLAEEAEDIRAIVVPLGEALAAVASGEIDTSPLMVSLLWLELNAGRLRAAWSEAD